MTRSDLFKLIAENSTSFMQEQVLRDAVDKYTETVKGEMQHQSILDTCFNNGCKLDCIDCPNK